MRSLFSLLLFMGLLLGPTQFAYSGAASKVVDLLVNDSGLSELLTRKGIRGVAANRVKNSVRNSLMNLNYNGELPSAYQLKRILKNLSVDSSSGSPDAGLKAKLRSFINKSGDDITPDELTEVVNDLIYLSHRYGNGQATALACSQCVSDPLYKKGFKYTLEILEDSNSKKVMKQFLPKNSKQTRSFVFKTMKQEQLGDFSRATMDILSREEEKSLALFLGLKKLGSKKQKDFVQAVLDVSRKPDGSVQLLDPSNKHKLWKLFADDLGEKKLEGWTKILREVASESQGQRSKREAFFRVLEKRAGDHEGMKKQIKVLKRKNCFFQ
ncbi:MAG: hypothetical protein KC493_16380 [Bacteriovoracaceae bacterium]|nr:hypothetical protein [Bacteriovoracaceae bacterium]